MKTTGLSWLDKFLSGFYNPDNPATPPSVGGEIPSGTATGFVPDILSGLKALFGNVIFMLILIAVIIFGWKWR